jgi:hypothetical protein
MVQPKQKKQKPGKRKKQLVEAEKQGTVEVQPKSNTRKRKKV